MNIKKLPQIKGFRSFKEFSWPLELPEFHRFNLIYGWNGSGKTTLSSLLRLLEIGEPIESGEASITFGTGDVSLKPFVPEIRFKNEIRVFNKDFISENVFTDTDQVSQIFIGKPEVEKNAEVQHSRSKIKLLEQRKIKCERFLGNRRAAWGETCKHQAKRIKEYLRSSGANPYNTYTRANFSLNIDALLESMEQGGDEVAFLTDEEKKILEEERNLRERPSLIPLSVSFPDLNQLVKDIVAMLQKTVVSQVIERLETNADAAKWVSEGLVYHKGESGCFFCGQQIPDSRIKELENHFNADYSEFLHQIDEKIGVIRKGIEAFQKSELPREDQFYPEFQKQYQNQKGLFDLLTSSVRNFLLACIHELETKTLSPFKAMRWTREILPIDKAPVTEIGKLIEQHNEVSINLKEKMDSARKRLERDILFESLKEKRIVKSQEIKASRLFKTIDSQKKSLEEKVSLLEKDLVSSRKPAKQINQDLESYLGHSDIALSFHETGYRINRGGKAISGRSLSEGEQTALAFLYFLKSLEDNDFNSAEGVVVIDDPISSLDANSIYHAYGFMKKRTKEVGQLFILTHNYTFFQQVKKWFSFLKKAERSFYMLTCNLSASGRSSELQRLCGFLEKYESEYQYLFKLVYLGANTEESFERSYHYPNLSRRLLEAFLAFKYPDMKSGTSMDKRMQDISFDEPKKAKILRFVNTHSHSRFVEDSCSNDMSVLSETKSVLGIVLELMHSVDDVHCERMANAIEREIATETS